MAFQTSQSIFREIFGEGKPDKTIVEEFLIQITKYLDNVSDTYQEAKKLTDWIKDGNLMLCFNCRADLIDDMSDYFKDNAIPFLAVMEPTGHMGYIIRSCDANKANQARDYILESKAKYCNIMTGEELKEKISKTKEKDKNILYISDLSAEEADVLREYCERELNDNDIGIDEMEDGTYTFSFIGKKALRKKRTQDKSLAFIFLEAMMAIHGPNKLKVERMARNHIALENAIGKRFRKDNINLNQTPAWVIGKDNRYIKVDDTGFEYGRAVMKNGDIELKEEFTADISMPDYDSQLNSYLIRMRDGTYTYNINEAYQHFRNPKESTLIVQSTQQDKIIKKVEHDIASAVNDVIERKNVNDPIMQMSERWDEKFNHTIHNMVNLMTGIIYPNKPMDKEIDGVQVTGFTKEDVNKVVSVLERYGIDMDIYENAANRLENIDTHLDKPMFARFNQQELSGKLHQQKEHTEDKDKDRESRRRFSGERGK